MLMKIDKIREMSSPDLEKELGELVQETLLTGGKESIEIGKDTLVIRDEKTDRTRYYYVVIEFLNKENQNEMMSSKLNGRIHVELTPEKTKWQEASTQP